MKTIRIITILVILTGIIIIRCSIDEPVLPTWAVSFIVPIAPEKIIFQEHLTNDSTVVVEGDTLFVQIEDTLESVEISPSDLALPPVDSMKIFTLDSIRLDTLNNMTTGNLNASELIPGIEILVGQTITIPDTTISGSVDLIDTDDFRSVRVTEGEVEVTLYNHLPITVGPNISSPEGLHLTLYDSTGMLISEMNISDDIPPGSQITRASPISHDSSPIYSPLTLAYDLPIAHDTTFTLTQQVLDSSYFRADLVFRNLSVLEIVGKVGKQTYRDNWGIDLNQDNKVIRAEIAEGNLHISFQSHIPLKATLDFTLPDFKTADGQPFQKQVSFDQNGTAALDENFSGYFLENAENPGEAIDSLKVITQMKTKRSDEYVHVTNTDKIEIQIQTDSIKFKYLEGYLAQDTLQIDPFTENNILDYEGVEQGIRLQEARLQTFLNTESEFDSILLNFVIKGYHKNAEGQVTDSAKIILDNELVQTGNRNMITLEGPEIVDFLNIYPTDITGYGNVVYSGYAKVRSGDEVSVNYLFTTPFKVEIIDPLPIEVDPDTLDNSDIDEEIRDAAGDEVQYAALTSHLTNHSPLGGELQLIVSGNWQRKSLYDTTNLNPSLEYVKTVQLDKAPVDPSTGFVTTASENTINFNLTKSQLEIFQNPPLRLGFLIKLQETDGAVILQGSDYLEISGQVEVKLKVHD